MLDTEEVGNSLRELIQRRSWDELRSRIRDMNPSDVADLIIALPPEEEVFVCRLDRSPAETGLRSPFGAVVAALAAPDEERSGDARDDPGGGAAGACARDAANCFLLDDALRRLDDDPADECVSPVQDGHAPRLAHSAPPLRPRVAHT